MIHVYRKWAGLYDRPQKMGKILTKRTEGMKAKKQDVESPAGTLMKENGEKKKKNEQINRKYLKYRRTHFIEAYLHLNRQRSCLYQFYI